jgi:hypothetical protein
MVKRIMLTLDDEQYKIIQSIKGFGTKDAEIAKNIIIAYLSEKSYIKKASTE